jgi:hypothetical protein
LLGDSAIDFVRELEIKPMSIVLEREAPPFREDETGAIRIGKTRVLLELVIRAFLDGASPETIVQQYSTLSLSDTYSAIHTFKP